MDLLCFGVKSWTEKRKIEERGRKEWTRHLSTLPSLTSGATGLGRPIPGLPNFEPASQSTTNPRLGRLSTIEPPDYYLLTVFCDRDSSLLALFGSLVQCTLQLVLQSISLVEHYRAQLPSSNTNLLVPPPPLSPWHYYRPDSVLSTSLGATGATSTYRHPFTGKSFRTLSLPHGPIKQSHSSISSLINYPLVRIYIYIYIYT